MLAFYLVFLLRYRGNSKYHYYGIRIKATSPLNQYTDEQTDGYETTAHESRQKVGDIYKKYSYI